MNQIHEEGWGPWGRQSLPGTCIRLGERGTYRLRWGKDTGSKTPRCSSASLQLPWITCLLLAGSKGTTAAQLAEEFSPPAKREKCRVRTKRRK